MIRQEEVYRIGTIGKAHGVRGELQMTITDDAFDRVDADYLVLDIDGILVPFFIDSYRFRSDNAVLIKFADIDTEQRARQLTGTEVYFPRHLSDSDEETITWAEIIGYTLVDAQSGQVVGEITDVDDSTINLLFNVKSLDGDEIMIPAHGHLIESVDKESRQITLTIPEGLLTLNASDTSSDTDED